MNRAEAITILAGLYRIPVENGADEFASEINEAIDMAIEALTNVQNMHKGMMAEQSNKIRNIYNLGDKKGY